MTRRTVGPLAGAALLALSLGWFASASAESGHHPVNLSLLYPISTNRDRDVSTNFRLSLLYGRVGAVRGVDLNGGVAVTGGSFRGVQVTGLYSETGGDFRGFSGTAGVSYLARDGRGVQLAGLSNFDRGRFVGVQYAWFLNFTEKGFSGAQLSTTVNLSDADGRYVQVAGVGNVSAGSFGGVQIAGGVNHVNEHLAGVQIGLLNLALTFRGAQVGLVNVAGEARGVQVGAINWVREHKGVPIGVVNLAAHGNSDWVIFGSTLAAVNTGWRTRVNGWNATLSVGAVDLDEDRGDTAFLGWHWGPEFVLAAKWKLGVDLGYHHIIPQSDDDPEVNDRLRYALQARALIEYQAAGKVSVFAGGGASVIFSEYSKDADSKTDPLAVLGVSLY